MIKTPTILIFNDFAYVIRITDGRDMTETVPLGNTSGGRISELVLEARLREYFRKRKPSRVNLIIKTPECIIRFVKLPRLDDKDLKMLISLNRCEYFPSPVDGHTVSHRFFGESGGERPAMLAALPDEVSEPYLKVFDNLKIKIDKLDIFQNAAIYSFADTRGPRVMAVLHNGRINATFINDGEPISIREIHGPDADGELSMLAGMYGIPGSLTVYAASPDYDDICGLLPGREVARIDIAEILKNYA